LNVIALRAEPLQLEAVLKRLGYSAIAGARNFQFEKTIPNSKETMRIEFMAPEEFKRAADFRVGVQKGIHARACTGGTIALAESDEYPLEGRLPDGESYAAKVFVTGPHALVMFKLLALFDRYHNIRARRKHGTIARKRRRMQRTLWRSSKRARTGQSSGGRSVWGTVWRGRGIGQTRLTDSERFLSRPIAPGYLLYEEYLAATLPAGATTQVEIRHETALAHRTLQKLLPEPRLQKK
jgi:hypothetical protein